MVDQAKANNNIDYLNDWAVSHGDAVHGARVIANLSGLGIRRVRAILKDGQMNAGEAEILTAAARQADRRFTLVATDAATVDAPEEPVQNDAAAEEAALQETQAKAAQEAERLAQEDARRALELLAAKGGDDTVERNGGGRKAEEIDPNSEFGKEVAAAKVRLNEGDDIPSIVRSRMTRVGLERVKKRVGSITDSVFSGGIAIDRKTAEQFDGVFDALSEGFYPSLEALVVAAEQLRRENGGKKANGEPGTPRIVRKDVPSDEQLQAAYDIVGPDRARCNRQMVRAMSAAGGPTNFVTKIGTVAGGVWAHNVVPSLKEAQAFDELFAQMDAVPEPNFVALTIAQQAKWAEQALPGEQDIAGEAKAQVKHRMDAALKKLRLDKYKERFREFVGPLAEVVGDERVKHIQRADQLPTLEEAMALDAFIDNVMPERNFTYSLTGVVFAAMQKMREAGISPAGEEPQPAAPKPPSGDGDTPGKPTGGADVETDKGVRAPEQEMVARAAAAIEADGLGQVMSALIDIAGGGNAITGPMRLGIGGGRINQMRAGKQPTPEEARKIDAKLGGDITFTTTAVIEAMRQKGIRRD